MTNSNKKKYKFRHVVSDRILEAEENTDALMAYRSNSDVLLELTGMSNAQADKAATELKEAWEEKEYLRRVKHRRRFGPPGEMPEHMKKKAPQAQANSTPPKEETQDSNGEA